MTELDYFDVVIHHMTVIDNRVAALTQHMHPPKPANDEEKEERSETRREDPDWTRRCMVCGAKPVVPSTGMCGPCTFGEADTAGGNW